jgi:thiol:disulfide interchange protein DsbA
MTVILTIMFLVFVEKSWTQGKKITTYQLVKEITEPRRWNNSDNKVEVIYYFWYGCPSCKLIDNYVTNIAKKFPEGTRFKKIPMVFPDNNVSREHAILFWTLEKMRIEESVRKNIFEAILPSNIIGPVTPQLVTLEAQIEFVKANQLNVDEFVAIRTSPYISDMLQKTFDNLSHINVDITPFFLVNGRYVVIIDENRPVSDFLFETLRLLKEEFAKSIINNSPNSIIIGK